MLNACSFLEHSKKGCHSNWLFQIENSTDKNMILCNSHVVDLSQMCVRDFFFDILSHRQSHCEVPASQAYTSDEHFGVGDDQSYREKPSV